MTETSRLLPGPDAVRKNHTDGTHRTVDPATTLSRVGPHLTAMGITRIGDVTGLDRIGIPVVMVTRPNSRSLAVTQGKGLTLAAAKASGVMEAIESYHAEYPDLPLRLATENEMLRQHRVLRGADLPAAPDSPYHPDLPTLWTAGTDLLSAEEVWLPYELVHTHYTMVALPGAGSFTASSNGLASGNHPLEAVAHGLYEVIERDATVLWELRNATAQDDSRIELATVDDDACRSVLDRYERAGVRVAVWDQTSDIGLPAFCCEIIDDDEGPFDAVPAAAGMGAHPDRGVALLRALTEAAQSRLTAIAGSRDDQPRSAYQDSHDPDTLAAHRELLAGNGRTDFRQVHGIATDTIDEDLREVYLRMRKAGIEQIVAVDLHQPRFGIDVVRVVAPGLEHLEFGAPEFVPGPRARRVAEKAVGR